jgi:hypothetical protein
MWAHYAGNATGLVVEFRDLHKIFGGNDTGVDFYHRLLWIAAFTQPKAPRTTPRRAFSYSQLITILADLDAGFFCTVTASMPSL